MSSAAIAVYLSARAQKQRAAMIGFAIITLVFLYTTVVNVIERPDGLRIALVFIAAIVFFSILSRVLRSTELRIGKVTLDPGALEFVRAAANGGELHIIANKRQSGDWGEYQDKELAEREDHHIDQLEPVLFFEVEVEDASEFSCELLVRGVEISSPNGQTYRVLRATASSVSCRIQNGSAPPARFRTATSPGPRINRSPTLPASCFLARVILHPSLERSFASTKRNCAVAHGFTSGEDQNCFNDSRYGARITPRLVMNPVTRFPGVTSKAGLKTFTPAGAVTRAPKLVTSSL